MSAKYFSQFVFSFIANFTPYILEIPAVAYSSLATLAGAYGILIHSFFMVNKVNDETLKVEGLSELGKEVPLMQDIQDY